MSTFVLRILFTGLMAFIPNENGTEVTVLLLNADHYHTSDGSAMQPHKQVVYVRAGSCSGACDVDDTIAGSTFRELPSAAALDSLSYALGNGSAWLIAGSDIAVRKSSGAADLPALQIRDDVRGTVNGQPQIVPATSSGRGDFSWIPALQQLCTGGCTLDADLLATVPPDIVAARFKIDSGDLYTYSIARLASGDVTPVQFQRLDGTGNASSYVQAIASWVGLDIEVTGNSIDFVETRHDSSTGRTMTLSPDTTGKVEVAVVNLPPSVPPVSSNNDAPQVGKHFEMYYELLQNPPARETRLVPRIASGMSIPQISWTSVHPSSAVTSELLNRLRFEPGRSLYDRVICPPVQP